MRHGFRFKQGCFVLLAWLLSVAGADAAVDRFLDSVEYSSVNGHALVKVVFSSRVNYVKHFPAERSNTLEVHLQLFSLDSSTPAAQFDRESLLAPYSTQIPVAGITQESSDPTKPVLTVRFSRVVDYKVSLDTSHMTLLLELPNVPFADTNGKTAEAKPTLATATPAPIPTKEPAAPGDNAAQAQLFLANARKALERDEFRRAEDWIKRVLNLPDHPYRKDAEQLFGELREREKQAQAAAPKSIAKRGESKFDAQLESGRQALARGEVDAAVRIFSVIARTAPPAVAEQARSLLSQAESAKSKSADGAADLVDEVAQEGEPSTPGESTKKDSADADAKRYIDQANAALKAGDPGEAIRLYTLVLELPLNSHTKEAERLLRTARGTQAQRSRDDMEGPVIGDPQTLDDVERLMEQGQVALRDGNNNRAIVIFTKVIGLPDHKYMPDAKEYLALARQRNGQVAEAKGIYEAYLKEYPKGQNTERVRQRLAEIISSTMKPRQVAKSRTKEDLKFRSDTFGSAAQTYNWGIREVPVTEAGDVNVPDQPGQTKTVREEDQSVLISYISASNRTRNSRYDIRTMFNGTHQKNFLRDDRKDRLLVSQMYVDFNDRDKKYQVKLGRQSGTTAGTLGRFDGLLGGYDVLPKLRVNAAVGFPVDLSNKDSIDFGTVMGALNAQFKDVLPQLDLIPFMSYQTVNSGVLDRFAVGEEIRYFNPRGTLFQVLDYDTLFGKLNLFYLQGQLNFGQETTVYASFDYRASPFYSIRSALYNDTVRTANQIFTLEDLFANYSEPEARDIAALQTGSATSAVLGASHSLNEKIQVSGDFTWASQAYSEGQLTESPTLPASEDAFTITGRVTTTGIIATSEITILSLSYNSASTSDESSFIFQNRAPFGEGWRIDSEFRTSFRADTSGQDLTRFRPAMKLVYDWKRTWSVEAEFGAEFNSYGGEATQSDTTRYFGSIGYRVNF